jgi:hypothetical protein
MLIQKKTLFLIACVVGADALALADSCPPPPSAVNPTLSVSTSYDKKNREYKYTYTLRNGANSQIPLNYFGLLLDQAPASVLSPQDWGGNFASLDSSPHRFRWSTTTVAAAEANKVSGDGTLSPPIYAIQPGKTLSGFEVSSQEPPGVAQFFAQGFTQIASGIPMATNDEPTPNCPAWDFSNPQLETQVTGATTGPSDPSVLSVIIRAREETGLHFCQPLNPKNPGGKIAVLVFSTHSFDASQINVSSVIFGPGYAVPLSSKLVPGGIGESLGTDERGDWEKAMQGIRPDFADRKNVPPKNLLLIFEAASLDIQCNLDQALFLRGSTTSGQQFVGAVSANVVGCGPTDFGQHKHHPFPFRWWIPQLGH